MRSSEIRGFNPHTKQITVEVVLPVEMYDYVKTQSVQQNRNFSGMLHVMLSHYKETPNTRLADEIETEKKRRYVCQRCGNTLKLGQANSLATMERLEELTKKGRVELEFDPSTNSWRSGLGTPGHPPKFRDIYESLPEAILAMEKDS